MILQCLGVGMLARLMRLEDAAQLDTSWLLFGPADDPPVEEVEPEPVVFRYAAE